MRSLTLAIAACLATYAFADDSQHLLSIDHLRAGSFNGTGDFGATCAYLCP